MKLLQVACLPMAALVALSGCVHDGQPRVLRQEVANRKGECDTLERSIAPSRDRSGNISILGQGVGLRDAVVSNTGARDQYLIGILNLITQCRRWQRFEIGAREYRDAQLALATAVTSSVDAAAVDLTLSRLAAVIADAHHVSADRAEELRDQLRQLSERPPIPTDLNPELVSRLERIEALLARGEAPAAPGARASSAEWRLIFQPSSAEPTGDDVARLLAGLDRWGRGCAEGTVTIIGFADMVGPHAPNLELAWARADAVYGRIRLQPGISYTASSGGETTSFGPTLSANRIATVRAVCTAQ